MVKRRINSNDCAKKKLLFEYLVFLLEQWKQEIHLSYVPPFTKLKLQKILFLVAAVNSTNDKHPLLEVFNRFYALPYGPVELDIYEAMNSNQFDKIQFERNQCICNCSEMDFIGLEGPIKKEMNDALLTIKSMGANYITISVFDLVAITHKWTSWQVAYQVADMLGNKKEFMSTDDICNSAVKAFI